MKVITKRLPTDFRAAIQDATRELLGNQEKDVAVSYVLGHRHPVMDNDKISIYINAYAGSGGARVVVPERIFGIPMRRRGCLSYPSSGLGKTIKDGDYEVAEVIGNNIYVLSNPLQTTGEVVLYKEILKRSIKKLHPFKKRISSCTLKEIANSRKFVKINNEKHSLSRRLGDITRYKDAIDNIENQILETRKRIAELETKPEIESKDIKKELLRIQEVKHVHTLGHAILIQTKEIHTSILVDGERKNLGELFLYLKSSGDLPFVYSVSGRRPATPHSMDGGTICWGGASDNLYDLLNDGEIGTLIEMVIEFLKQPNLDDSYGRRIYRFPKAKGV